MLIDSFLNFYTVHSSELNCFSGSILGGLENNTLKPLVEQAMPTLIELMYDQSVVVRDTVAWTFGRICEIIPEAAINENYLKMLLESLVNGLKVKLLEICRIHNTCLVVVCKVVSLLYFEW